MSQAPFADAVLRLHGSNRPEADIVSFHALPWANGASLRDADVLRGKYERLFGREFLASEMTYSGAVLDSFFQPTGPLDLAQRMAADAFGSDYTFFLTCGTTVANRIAMDALPGRILVDRTAHHSIHMAMPATADYAPSTELSGGQVVLDVPATLAMLTAADPPYDAVVLAGSSYDGVRYHLPAMLTEFRSASPATRTFLVDEAWSAITAFHPELAGTGGLVAAQRLRASGDDVRVIVTHSAHKSMSAARQGAYLHVVGDDRLLADVRSAVYRRHTTSPSIPILASLDLARAHAQADGARLLRRAIEQADRLRDAVSGDPVLKAAYAIVPPSFENAARYFTADPTATVVDVSGLEISGARAKELLFHRHGVHVARVIPNGFVLRWHIGIDAAQTDRLLTALRALAHRSRTTEPAVPAVGATVRELIIGYPPGVPIAVPGEVWTEARQRKLDALRREGVDIHTLRPHVDAGPDRAFD